MTNPIAGIYELATIIALPKEKPYVVSNTIYILLSLYLPQTALAANYPITPPASPATAKGCVVFNDKS